MSLYSMTPEERIEALHKILADIMVDCVLVLFDQTSELFPMTPEEVYEAVGKKVEAHVLSAFDGDVGELRTLLERYHQQRINEANQIWDAVRTLSEAAHAMQGSEYVQ